MDGLYCCLLALFVKSYVMAPSGGHIIWFQSCCMFQGKIVEILPLLSNLSCVMFYQVCLCLRKLFLKLAANGKDRLLCTAR